MAKQQVCPFCGEDLEEPPAIHGENVCAVTELLNGRWEIKRLKQSVFDWKGAWFQLREIIGEMWWHHRAIDSDTQRAYHQKVLRRISGKPELQPWAAHHTYAPDGTIQRDGQVIGCWKR